MAKIIGTRVALRKNDYEFSIFVKDGVYHPSNEEVQKYNQGIDLLVERRNAQMMQGHDVLSRDLDEGARKKEILFPITTVDMYKTLDEDTDFADSLHPDDSGEVKMAIQWFEAIIQSEWWKAVAGRAMA